MYQLVGIHKIQQRRHTVESNLDAIPFNPVDSSIPKNGRRSNFSEACAKPEQVKTYTDRPSSNDELLKTALVNNEKY
jgi:hypothetical protein